jgi:histone H3/H4
MRRGSNVFKPLEEILFAGGIVYISESTVRRILKEAGARRVRSEASTELQKYVNRIAFDTAQKAVMLSQHAKRKMIDVSDVKLACS